MSKDFYAECLRNSLDCGTMLHVMSTAVAPPPTMRKQRTYFASDLKMDSTFTGHKVTMNADGTGVVHDIPIFRVGTFRDSWGEQRTWTAEHLLQLVAHFDLLRTQNILPDVPVRSDHSVSVDKVIGYFEAIRFDGEFLNADIHVTEPPALGKLQRGTYRSRSAEIGMYVTNDEAGYYPVLFGVAYVDLPAVEGLNHSASMDRQFFSLIDTQERPMSTETTDPTKPATPPDIPPSPATHSTPPAFTFSVNGQTTSDFAAVQRHITALEAEVKTQRDTLKDLDEMSRKAFVKGLSDKQIIGGPQVAELEAFAIGLSVEQYEAWVKTWDGAPTNRLLANHGGSGTGEPPTPEQQAGAADEKVGLENQLAMFKRMGKSDEDIQKTTAYKRLQTLTTAS